MSQLAKDWKSIDEQIEIMRSRGMIVDDVIQGRQFLKCVGYYRLSGYAFPFRQENAAGEKIDDFVEDSHFEDVIALYLFDRKLRLLALDAIERIELAIQVEVAHLLGKRDPFAHETPSQLHGNFAKKTGRDDKTQHDRWLEDYERLVDRSKRKPFVAHNLQKYGKLPIWVAIEIFDFGTLSRLYAGLNIKDKIQIEKQFGLNEGKHLQTWLRSLNFIRNTAAHHSRLWNCNIIDRAKMPKSKTKLVQLTNSRPFLYFCIMQTMMQIICPDSYWKQKFIHLLHEFPNVENTAITIADMGVVEGWEEWSIWK